MQIQNGPFWAKSLPFLHQLSFCVSEGKKNFLNIKIMVVGMPTKGFLLFQLILSGISQILIISPMEDVVSTKIAVIRNSDSILVLVPACGHGTDGWQQGARGRGIAAAPAQPHPSLMSYTHTQSCASKTKRRWWVPLAPRGGWFGVSQVLLSRVKLARLGSLALGPGINPAHSGSVSWGKMGKLMWVSWTHHRVSREMPLSFHILDWTWTSATALHGTCSRDKLKILWQWVKEKPQSFILSKTRGRNPGERCLIL